MGVISLDEVRPGMALASPVSNRQGVILLQQGAQISERHLNILKSWGVTELDVVGVQEVSLEDLEAEMAKDPKLAAMSKKLDNLFARVKDEPLMKKLLQIAKKQLLKKWISEKSAKS